MRLAKIAKIELSNAIARARDLTPRNTDG